MGRHGDLRPGPLVHLLELVAARVARDVDARMVALGVEDGRPCRRACSAGCGWRPRCPGSRGRRTPRCRPAPRLTCGWVPSAMRDRAARASPWLPVHRNRILSSGKEKPASASETKSSTSCRKPTERAAAAMRCMERPTRHTRRSLAWAARMAVSMRATFEAKQATATLPFKVEISLFMATRTSASEPPRRRRTHWCCRRPWPARPRRRGG